jgi:DNA-binding LytR/AlgR family response regulator
VSSESGFGTLRIDLRDANQLAEFRRALGRMDRVSVNAPTGNAQHLIARASILYGRAIGDYVRIVSDEGRFLVRGRISEMESRWERFGFVRTHRAYVVNATRVQEVRRNGNGTASLRLEGGETIPVSRRRFVDVRAALTA